MSERRALRACLLVLAYVTLALLFTYPLVFHLGTHHVGEAGGDAKTYLWGYWWVKSALVDLGTNPFETDRIFYPLGIGLALHTLGFLQGLMFTPTSFVTGEVAAANLVVLWTFVASSLAAYALARHVGASRSGAFLAGIIFGFCPYRLARLAGHYDLLGTEWIPLFALLLWKIRERERFSWRLALSAGLVAAACGYTASSYLVFLGFFTILYVSFHHERFRSIAPHLAAAGLVAVLLLSPLLAQARKDLSLWSYPSYPGADRYVADVAAYARPSPSQALLGESLGHAYEDNVTETTVFAGYVVLGLALLGCLRWRRDPALRFWLVAAGVFFVASLGSSLHLAGWDTGVPMPFWLLTEIPVLEHLRAPARLAVLVMLSLAVVAARVSSKWRPMTTLGISVLVALEFLTAPVALFAAATHRVYTLIATDPAEVTVIEVPGIEQSPAEVMYHQTEHEKPIFIGTAARVPGEKSEYYFGLPFVRPLIDLRKGKIPLTDALVDRERGAAPKVARFLGIGYVVLHKAYEKRGVVDFVEAVLPVERTYEDDSLVLLRVRREALPPAPTLLRADSPESRQHFESGWLRPEDDFRWAHRTRSTLLFRRPPSARVLAIELAPLEGLPQNVRAELDGHPLGRFELEKGWQTVRLDLPATRRAGEVERLTLRWGALRVASERDPRALAVRVRAVRLE